MPRYQARVIEDNLSAAFSIVANAQSLDRELLADEAREIRKHVRAIEQVTNTRGSRSMSDKISLDQLAEQIRGRLDGISDDVNGRLDSFGERISALEGPTERKVKFGNNSTPTRADNYFLTRNQSMHDWMRAKGQINAGDQGLSFDRYIRGLVKGEWDDESSKERELYSRALNEGTVGQGGHLVPTPLFGQVIDLARNHSRVFQAGATTVPMTSQTLKVPRLIGEGTPTWHAENATISSQDLSFDSVTFTARTLTRMITLSIELFEDSDPSANDVIRNSFAQQIALELDRVALRGSGTAPEPRGILNQSGVTLAPHGTDGAAVTNYDFHLDSVGTVRMNNFEPTAQLQSPRVETILSKLKETTTNAYLAPPLGLADIPRLNTKQIPINLTTGSSTDTTEIYTGQWNMLMIGIRTSLWIRLLNERFIDEGKYAFMAWMRADVQLAQPSAFVVDTGVKTT